MKKQARLIITCACGCGRVGPHAARGLVHVCYYRAKRDRRVLAQFPPIRPRKAGNGVRGLRRCPKCGTCYPSASYGQGKRCANCTQPRPPRPLPQGCVKLWHYDRIQVQIYVGGRVLYLGIVPLGQVDRADAMYQAARAVRSAGGDKAAIKAAALAARRGR